MTPYKSHELLPQIDNNPTIWRFMSFEKFLSLIQTSTLYFASAEGISKYFDPWEGVFPQETIDFTYESFKKHHDEKVSKNADTLIDHVKNPRLVSYKNWLFSINGFMEISMNRSMEIG